jgi:hypothetical protein
LDPAFLRSGSGWKQASSGYRKHHYWVPARSGSLVRQGNWKPVLEQPGYYKILVKLPANNATSRQAKYRIKTADGWVTRVRNQSKRAGDWVGLGVHRLTTTPILKLVDKTGEAGSLGRRLAYDAARFEPTTAPAVKNQAASKARAGNPKRATMPRQTKPGAPPNPEQPPKSERESTGLGEPDDDRAPDPADTNRQPPPSPAESPPPSPDTQPSAGDPGST